MRERHEMVLADLIQIRAEQTPDLDVLTFEHLSLDDRATPDEVRSYGDLQTNANRLAAGLAAKGVGVGDRIAIMMRNHPEFVEGMIAASILGALFVPIDPRTRGEKLAYMLRNSGAVGALCADTCLDELASVRDQVPDLAWLLAIETGEPAPSIADTPGALPLREILETPADTLELGGDGLLAPLQIMYTSGTTGDPKGIVGVNMRFCAAGMLADLFPYGPDERPYTGLSFTHGNAQSVTLAPALTRGLRAVISRRFTKSRLWDVCRSLGCTSFSLVGGMATAIYSQPEQGDDADNPVRMVVSGGMPPAIWEAFEKRFDLRVFEFYGAMDGGGMAFKPVGQGPIGSFGKPMDSIEMKILDADDKECAPGVVGEICVRPAGGGEAEVEYFGNPDASKKKIRRGWNRSGDMGHRDADDWLFFDYRTGGGIRHNGDFINPSFVEKAIAEHPAVTDVFVYGVTAASGAPGEKDVVAAIAFAESAPHDTDAVFAQCREKLEPNFVPSYLQVVDQIPKTASEKPQERILLQQFDANASNVHRPSGA
ncbi:MAG: AMP-binding protein [Deltaproteobacteria bacterium]|nr:AMP-binding protein [Deltaproteobacteria bacterium]